MFFTFSETRVTPCQMGIPTFVYMRGTVRLAFGLPGARPLVALGDILHIFVKDG